MAEHNNIWSSIQEGKITSVLRYHVTGGDILIRNSEGQTLLHAAAKQPDRCIVTALCLYKIPKDSVDNAGRTALLLACQHNQLDNVKALVQSFASIDEAVTGDTGPLHAAVVVNNADMVDFLLQNKCDVNKQTTKTLDTALHVACRQGKESLAAMLLAAGANETLKNARGQTAAQLASFRLTDVAARVRLPSTIATFCISPPATPASQSPVARRRRAVSPTAYHELVRRASETIDTIKKEQEQQRSRLSSSSSQRTLNNNRANEMDNRVAQIEMELSKITVMLQELCAMNKDGDGYYTLRKSRSNRSFSSQPDLFGDDSPLSPGSSTSFGLTDKDLAVMAKNIGVDEWYFMGIHLDISPQHLDAIKADNVEIRQTIFRMLLTAVQRFRSRGEADEHILDLLQEARCNATGENDKEKK